MASNLILTATQAQAVYSAMCALNNVGARISVEVECANALENGDGSISVWPDWGMSDEQEVYESQAAFAAAYGLRAAPDLVSALRAAHNDIQRLPGHTIDMLGRIEAAIAQAAA